MVAATVKRWTPRPYQPLMARHILAHRRSALFVPMGMGKSSATLAAIAGLLLAGLAEKVLIIAPLRVARSTWPGEVGMWENFSHLRVAMILGDAKEREAALASDADIYTINPENVPWLEVALAKRQNPFDMVVLDECFAGDTKVLTQQGSKRIDSLTVGDTVVTPSGLRKIAHVFRKQTRKLVRVHLSDGRTVVCTPTHRFRSEGEWVAAERLVGHRVVRAEDLPSVRGHVRYRGEEAEESEVGPVLHSFLFRDGVPRQDAPGCAESHRGEGVAPLDQEERGVECGRSDARRDEGETFCHPQAEGGPIQRYDSRGEREGDVPHGKRSQQRAPSGVGVELRGEHKAVAAGGLGGTTEPLQARLRLAEDDGVPGGGRDDTQQPEGESQRREESEGFGGVRVVCVEAIECRSAVPVWDLEVEDAHVYFAEGVLVHNCTKWKSTRMRQGGVRGRSLLKILDRGVKYVVAATGTPSPNGLKDLYGQMLLLDQGQRLGRTYSAFMSRWFRPRPGGDPRYPVMEPMPHAQDEIQSVIKDICLVLKAEDWFDLEEPVTNTIYVDLPTEVRKRYRELEREMFTVLDGIEIETFGAAAKTMKCLQVANGAAYVNGSTEEWVEVHDEKIEALRSVIEETAGAPLLVVFNFRSDLARLCRHFPHGRGLDNDPRTIEAWNRGEIPLLFLHPASAGHGLSLQHGGNTVVFFGLNWNLEEHMQVIERIGPVRQKQSGYNRAVFVHYIVARKTVDETVLERLRSKRSVQEVLLDAMNGYKNHVAAAAEDESRIAEALRTMYGQQEESEDE